jgi:dinuclear metal center YbgI/SA1388 family protein
VSIPAAELAAALDRFLRVHEIPDKSLNGLQVDGPDPVSRAALATDAALATIEAARAGGAQLLVVHHGLFWGERPVPLTGGLWRRVAALIGGRLALYAAHLPLDVHPEVGNNAVLARRLELVRPAPFGVRPGLPPDREGRPGALGLGGGLARPLDRAGLRAWCSERLGSPVSLLPFGPEHVTSLAVVSGDAADLAPEAAREGYDAFLTGETSHTAYHPALEAGVNLLCAGHYATETWGVRALGEHLERRHGVETFFCDVPTGL